MDIAEPIHKILCCDCGQPIEPNQANMCINCIRSKIDITEGIIKGSDLQWCKGCHRYMNQNNQYVLCQPESKELLAICLKKLKGLNQVRLIDASFIWTEPHSKRIKIKIVIQKEVNEGAILQQSMVIEYIVMNQMCDDCHKREAKDFWKAVVQIRQKVTSKKTFAYLEQVMLKHNATSHVSSIKPEHGGLDFYFGTKDEARKFSDFIQNVIPCKAKYSQRLISHDIHSNTFNYKSTYSLDIIPITKDSLVCLSARLASYLGLPSNHRIVLCHKLTKSVHLVDPLTATTVEINSTLYNNLLGNASSCSAKSENVYGFEALTDGDESRLQRFIVMDIEMNAPRNNQSSSLSLNTEGKANSFSMADCWLTRDTDENSSNITAFGNDLIFCRTHLGHILKPGDCVLGLHFPTYNANNRYLDLMKDSTIPDLIIVKKIYPKEQRQKAKRRNRKKKSAKSKNNDDMESTTEFETMTECTESQMGETIDNSDSDKDSEDLNVEIDEFDAVNASKPKLSLQEMLEDFHMKN